MAHGIIEITPRQGGATRTELLLHNEVTIGSHSGCVVHLEGADDAVYARFLVDRTTSAVQLEMVDVDGEYGGAPLPRGVRIRLEEGVVIFMEAYQVRWLRDRKASAPEQVGEDRVFEAWLRQLHEAIVEHIGDRPIPEAAQLTKLVREQFLSRREHAPKDQAELVAARIYLSERLYDTVLLVGQVPPRFGADVTRAIEEVARELELERTPAARDPDLDRLRDRGAEVTRRAVGNLPPGIRNTFARELAVETMESLMLRDGPLTRFLRLPEIYEEIVVNGAADIRVARNGVFERTPSRFPSEDALWAVCERIVIRGGGHLDRSKPFADVKLPDGTRGCLVIPPITDCPVLTLRRFPASWRNLSQLVENQLMPEAAASFLRACVKTAKNVLVSGGTGTGKSTLVAALCGHVGPRERIVLIEDTAELQLQHDHVLRFLTVLANAEGRGGVEQGDLVRIALRCRPDRIVVGEIRDPNAVRGVLQAVSTGHAGAMTTVHADSEADAVVRVEALAGMTDGRIARFQIGRGFQVVVQLRRFEHGRRVTGISEVRGYDANTDRVQVEPIYQYSARAGRLRFSGYVPSFSAELERKAGFSPGALFV